MYRFNFQCLPGTWQVRNWWDFNRLCWLDNNKMIIGDQERCLEHTLMWLKVDLLTEVPYVVVGMMFDSRKTVDMMYIDERDMASTQFKIVWNRRRVKYYSKMNFLEHFHNATKCRNVTYLRLVIHQLKRLRTIPSTILPGQQSLNGADQVTKVLTMHFALAASLTSRCVMEAAMTLSIWTHSQTEVLTFVMNCYWLIAWLINKFNKTLVMYHFCLYIDWYMI